MSILPKKNHIFRFQLFNLLFCLKDSRRHLMTYVEHYGGDSTVLGPYVFWIKRL